jgi:hypothetical protein
MSLIEAALEVAFEELKSLILNEPDPCSAIEKAKRVIVADAADAATDAALDEALKRARG